MNAPATTAQNNPFGATSLAPRAQGGALAQSDQQRAIAEVQAAMMIARMNPRDPIVATDRILNACSRPTLADSAVYTYSRGGTDITGPSIRLAEAMAQSWGNMQFGIRELDQRNGESTVQAFAWDVETNTRREVTFQVPHVRYTKSGTKKLEDPRDVYEMVANQGARRLRACILAVIPGDVTEAAVAQCEVTMKAKADTSPDAVQKMLTAFEAFGVTRDQIEKRIQRRLDAIQPAQIVSLKKIYASLRDGMSAPADWFEGDGSTAAGEKTPPAKPEWTDAEFTKALPTWIKTMQAGRKAAADIIAMANTKATLTEAQQAQIRAAADRPAPSDADKLIDAMRAAKDTDTLDTHASAIDMLQIDEQDNAAAIYQACRKALVDAQQ